MAEQQQHVDFFRKVLLRKRLLKLAVPGGVYVPFIGDGDLAIKLYADRQVFGADLDPQRVTTARTRVKGDVRVCDCDIWPFPDVKTGPIAVADFDAYSEPYPSFRSFWKCAEKTDRMVMFFTDGHRMGLAWSGYFIRPDGEKMMLRGKGKVAKGRHMNAYYATHALPYVRDHVAKDGYRLVRKMMYSRGLMTYHGMVIERG